MVDNRLAGTAQPNSFTLTASGPTPLSGAGGIAATVVGVGQYTLSETGPSGYNAGAWNCTQGTLNGSLLTLALNQSALCTITNTHREADLRITKTPPSGQAVPGQQVTWTIVATNAGPDPVVGATISDTLPAGIASAAWTAVGAGGASGFAANGSGSISATVDMPVGSTITYTVLASVSASATGNLVNTATIGSPGDPADPNLSNNSATSTLTLAPSADVQITKLLASSNPAVPGQSVSWSITVKNNGPSDAANVTTTDAVPGSVTGLSLGGANAVSCSIAIQTVSCNFGTLAPNATRTYTITGTLGVDATGNLVNTATTTTTTPDPDTSNNSSTSTTPMAQSSLTVSKSNGTSTVLAGGTTTYTVTISNSGDAQATGVTWTDSPTGLQITEITGGNGTCTISPTIGCTGVTVPANSSVSFTVKANVTGAAGTDAVNTASVTGGGGCTVNAPCTSTDTDTIVAPNVTVAKSTPAIASVNTPPSGNQYTATYTVTVSNNGTADGTYTLTDTPAFSPNVTLDAWAVAVVGNGDADNVGTAFNPSSGAGTVGQVSASNLTLKPGKTHTYTVAITFTTSAVATNLTCTGEARNGAFNTASITGSTSASASGCGPVPAALNLTLGKTASVAQAANGDSFTYTLTASNSGPVATINPTTVVDVIPAGIEVQSITNGSNFTCTPSAGLPLAGNGSAAVTCTSTGGVAAGAVNVPVATLTVKKTNTANITNTATATAGDPRCTGEQNPCKASVEVTDNSKPSLTVLKAAPVIASVNTPPSGNQYTATYTVTVRNNGTADGTYTLADTPAFPATGITLNGWAVAVVGNADPDSVGTAVDPASGNGNVSQVSASNLTLKPGKTHTYTVSITFTTSAAATGLICTDPATPNNGAFNTATIAGNLTGTTAPGSSAATACGDLPAALNLTLKKEASVTHAAKGDSFTYTLKASNSGPAATTNPTTVVDTIPVGVKVTAINDGSGFACTPSPALPLTGDGSTTTVSCTSATGVAAGAVDVPVATLTVTKTNTADVVNNVKATAGDPRCTGEENPCKAAVTVTDNTAAPAVVTPVPTMTQWALMLLTALLVALTWLIRWNSLRSADGSHG
jgi:uncharacterized repeat protein (TIGR01451 family)